MNQQSTTMWDAVITIGSNGPLMLMIGITFGDAIKNFVSKVFSGLGDYLVSKFGKSDPMAPLTQQSQQKENDV